jgi:hypothetical protein
MWIGVALTLPFVTIVTAGFLSFGAAAAIVVLCFVGAFLRPRWIVVMAGLLIAFVGLSLATSYLRDRNDIRKVVWSGASIGQRLDAVYQTITEFDWFDPTNEDQTALLDDRLDQDGLIGLSQRHLEFNHDYAHGKTIWESIEALVPRALWPGKPIVAGSPEIVSRYTGLQFNTSTSVGVGHILELYINFGYIGVLVGSILIGMLLGVIDRLAATALAMDDWPKFALWFLVGISFMHVGGSLVELTSSAGASVVLILLINEVFLNRLQRRDAPQVTGSWGGAPSGSTAP